jgi:hypothetical protein
MLIYHKENGKITCTEVIIGFDKSSIKHSNYIWSKHKEQVAKLEDNGNVFVTGATFKGADYSGTFFKRDIFEEYLVA